MNHKIWSYLLCVLVSLSGVSLGELEVFYRKSDVDDKVIVFVKEMPLGRSSMEMLGAIRYGGQMYDTVNYCVIENGVLQQSEGMPTTHLQKLDLTDGIFTRFMTLMSSLAGLGKLNLLFDLKVSYFGDDESLKVKITAKYNDHPVSHSKERSNVDEIMHADMNESFPEYQQAINSILENYLRGSKFSLKNLTQHKEERKMEINDSITYVHVLMCTEEERRVKCAIIETMCKGYGIPFCAETGR
jgi:hypothetical protein